VQKKVTPTKQSIEFPEAQRLVDMTKRISIDGTQKKHAEAKKSFKTKSDTYLKYILNVKRSKLAYIILLLVITPKVIWMTKDFIPEATLFKINFNSAVNVFLANLDFLILNLLKSFNLVWIFIVITIFELTKSKNINNVSLARLNHSKGGKYADLIYFLLSFLADYFRIIGVFATLGIARLSDNFSGLLSDTYEKIFPADLLLSGSTTLFVFIIGLLLFELGEYVSHRFSHKFLWELHEFHHSATEMTILNVKRGTFLESAIVNFIQLPIMLLAILIINQSIEQGQWSIFILWTIFGIVGECFAYIGHSSLRLTFPKPISYIFLSPSLHWLHHSNNPEHHNKNFGRVLCIWDRIFGSYLDESHLKDIHSFGDANSEYNKYNPFFCFFILPFIKLFKKLFKETKLIFNHK
jgi:sterol desaturase/sphingolipid hydroxylase (fatty acid hydroxylase superfamily)